MSSNPASTRIVGIIPKAPDVECHVRVVDVENVRLVEVRDFIPSLQEYGRGYWVPMNEAALYGLMNSINEVLNSERIV